MTPLEIAAKAVGDTFDGQPGWTERCARAALLALAETRLPVAITGAGAAKIGGVRAQHGDGRHLWEARAAFPAMCRAIAEGGT